MVRLAHKALLKDNPEHDYFSDADVKGERVKDYAKRSDCPETMSSVLEEIEQNSGRGPQNSGAEVSFGIY